MWTAENRHRYGRSKPRYAICNDLGAFAVPQYAGISPPGKRTARPNLRVETFVKSSIGHRNRRRPNRPVPIDEASIPFK